jgi:single-stranded-DNA-specific exonuclease
LRDAELRDAKKIGREGRHLKGRLTAIGQELDCIAFSCDEALHQANAPIDCIGHLEVNRWKDRENVQFQLVDYRLSGEPVDWIPNG